MSDEYCIRKSGLKALATVFFSKNLQLIISLFGVTFILGQLLVKLKYMFNENI